MDGDKGKVLLLLTDLDETIATYEAYLKCFRRGNFSPSETSPSGEGLRVYGETGYGETG